MPEIVYEDNQIIVAVKPPNMLSQADKTGDTDILTRLKQYVKVKYNKDTGIAVLANADGTGAVSMYLEGDIPAYIYNGKSSVKALQVKTLANLTTAFEGYKLVKNGAIVAFYGVDSF